MRLLGGIKVLLHDQGQTIRGVAQRIADEGPGSVMAVAPELTAPEAARTRRVIRADDAPSRVIPFPRDGSDEGTPVEPGTSDVAPDRPSGPADAAPGRVAAASAPGDAGDMAQPDTPPAVAAQAPEDSGDPVELPDESPMEPETPPTDMELPPAISAKPSPMVVATRLAARARADGHRPDPRRLRRVVRRLRGLIEDVEDDLAG